MCLHIRHAPRPPLASMRLKYKVRLLTQYAACPGPLSPKSIKLCYRCHSATATQADGLSSAPIPQTVPWFYTGTSYYAVSFLI